MTATPLDVKRVLESRKQVRLPDKDDVKDLLRFINSFPPYRVRRARKKCRSKFDPSRKPRLNAEHHSMLVAGTNPPIDRRYFRLTKLERQLWLRNERQARDT